METIAILRNPSLSVGDRDYVTLQFDAALPGRVALQVIYLEDADDSPAPHGSKQFIELLRAAGSFERLNGLPIIVEDNRESRTILYRRPADC